MEGHEVCNQLDKEEHEREFSEFCTQLLVQRFDQVQLYTGSYFELPLIYFFENVTDVDNIMYDRNVCAIKKGASAPKNFNGTVLTIQCEGSRHGYARLCFRSNDIPYTYTMDSENRPACVDTLLQKADLGPHLLDKSDISSDLYSDPSSTIKWLANFQGLTRDFVEAIWCPHWPEEASEWKSRKRPSKWPSPNTVSNILHSGCFLVAKPHQESQFVLDEWRFSFSTAEFILIYTWSDVQMYVYHILRLIKSAVVKKCGGKKMTSLTTYHFKTLMFWACEEKPEVFWLPDNIESSVKDLLLIMIEWLIEKECRNYFMPDNDMLDHLPDSHAFDKEVQLLLDSVYLVDEYISSTVPFSGDPKHDLRKESSVRIPINLLYAIQLRASLWNIVDLLRSGRHHLYKPSIAIEKSCLFESDMRTLFHCLTIQRDLILNENLKDKLERFHEIKECFKLIQENKIAGFTHIDISPMDNFHTMFRKLLKKNVDSSDSIETLKDDPKQSEFIPDQGNSTQRVLCYSRSERTQRCQTACIVQLVFNIMNAQIVKPSCFHAAVYEANFYWTIFGEEKGYMAVESWKRAMKICDKWLSYAESLERASLPHIVCLGVRDLPIIVSHRWSIIFDRYIQLSFGFLLLVEGIRIRSVPSIHKFLKTGNHADFMVRVDPQDLLVYINYQCNYHLNKTLLLKDSFMQRRQNDNISRMLLNTAARVSIEARQTFVDVSGFLTSYFAMTTWKRSYGLY